ncbi:MAG: hypothetical protein KAZ88_11110 [Acidimicrobiia bacterium]|nr:hypothetical protein [Acidimicrobiia bacterium]
MPYPKSGRFVPGFRHVALLLLALTPVAFIPGTAGAATTVAIDPPRSMLQANDRVDIPVTVNADELIDGRIELVLGNSWDTQGTTYTMDIEVAAGARKSVTFPVIASFNGSDQLRVSVFDGDERVASASEDLNSMEPPRSLAFVLRPGSDDSPLPKTVPSDFDLPVTPVRALNSDRALTPGLLRDGVVIAEDKTIAAIDDSSAKVLGSWVREGGTLRVAGEGTPDLEALGLKWQPDASGVTIVDAGRVESVASVAAALTKPFRPGGSPLFSGAPVGPEALSRDLAASAGFEPVQVRFIGGFLLAYVLVAGPLLFGVTALMKRRRLIWIAVPLTAVLAVVAAVQLTKRQRAEQGMSHSTIISLEGSQAYVSTALGLSAPTSNTSLQLPKGFAAGSGGTSSNEVEVAIKDAGPLVTTLGGVGSFSVANAAGQIKAPGAVEVDVERRESKVVGTITNKMPWPLKDSVFQVGDAMQSLGTIEPGKSKKVDVDLSVVSDLTAAATAAWPSIVSLISGEQEDSENTGGVTGGLVLQLLSQPDAAGRNDARGTFLGFTDQLLDPFADGLEIPGNTLLTKSVSIGPADSMSAPDRAITPTQIQVIAMSQMDGRNVVRAHFADPEAARVEAEAGRLAIEGVTSGTPREYWDGRNWLQMEAQGDDAPVLIIPEDLEVDDLDGNGIPEDIDGDGFYDDLTGDGVIDLDGDGIGDVPMGTMTDTGQQNKRHFIPAVAIDDNGDVVMRIESQMGSMMQGMAVRFTPVDQLDKPPASPPSGMFGGGMPMPMPVDVPAVEMLTTAPLVPETTAEPASDDVESPSTVAATSGGE